MGIAPARRIGRFCRRFKLNERAGRCASPDQRDIGPPHAGISIFWQYSQSLPDWQDWDQSFEQLLERRGDRRLRNVGIRSAKIPDPLRVGLQDVDAHGFTLMYWLLSFIVMVPHKIAGFPLVFSLAHAPCYDGGHFMPRAQERNRTPSARQARFPQRSVRVIGIGEAFASAAGLRCRTPPRLPGKLRGMLSADSGGVTEMPDGPRYADLMLVPAGGMETSPA